MKNLVFKELLEWPNELNAEEGDLFDLGDDLKRCISLDRRSEFHEMESILLANMPNDKNGDYYFLFAYSLFWRKNYSQFLSVSQILIKKFPKREGFINIISALQELLKGNHEKSRSILSSITLYPAKDEMGPLIYLITAYSFYAQGKLEKASTVLLLNSRSSDCIEGVLLQAKILRAKFDYDSSISLLDSAIQKAPNNIQLVLELITILHAGKRGDRILSDVKKALSRFGFRSSLLSHLAPLKLLQREPGRALRACLQERAHCSITDILPKASNLFVAYEHSGNVNWSININPESILPLAQDPDFYANRCLQLASCGESHLSVQQAKMISKNFLVLSKKPFSYFFGNVNKTLRIAWLTGDCTNHPVARFLLGIFSASIGSFKHCHTVVSTVDHGKSSWLQHFDSLDGIKTFQFSQKDSANARLKYLRSLQIDIAIDLSGWTGGNSLQLFKERFAAVQVNYLGYFASAGFDSMDFWLGDRYLFPNPCLEFRSEAIYRLSRPFIAWQPTPSMPEYHSSVSAPPDGPLRIGTFNHNRKFSNTILKIWGKLLEKLPDTKIIFKAINRDDPHTQELLIRRFLRAEIDPNRIEWLPITKSPVEHLEQYSKLDLALDSFPNGGCTTTCEALWMGVPTVTLSGNSYVSRMSTSVMCAANLSEFVANSPDEYVNIVCQQASDLDGFRSKRLFRRNKFECSDLGNAKDLLMHLEASFDEMIKIKKEIMSN
ncbi:glycosyltransferase family 41 protein [Synechococcus sp. KORDI-100]|uniref:O-linked N-acetylglucosamine transferase family protein n=1 Tax=Synechococcus sp. KORDI-100 TaxID=1280380 RepID=UPI0009DF2261|nr:glycosyltransferase family 41 protein [Synechococcus sp. KORDI-100]